MSSDEILPESEAEASEQAPEAQTAPVEASAEIEESEVEANSVQTATPDSSQPDAESGSPDDAPVSAKSATMPEDESDLEADDADAGEDKEDDGEQNTDDPLAPGFDLDDGDPFDPDDPGVLPWRSKIASPKEFFNTEVLYRFDIIDPADVEPIEGTYRVELLGAEGGVWSLKIGQQLDVSNTREEAETVLSMDHSAFMKIVNGAMNPQLAILAKTIAITGNFKKAVLLQNLFAPSPD